MESNELAVRSETALAASNPANTVLKAQEIANALTPIIEKQKLYTLIGTKKHVWVEGWTSMLAMLKVFPEIEYVRKLERPNNEIAYEARAILKTLDGKVIGAAEHICSNKEKSKSFWDEYAVKSMAQTRAVGKAARLSFSWIMSIGGYAPTPAEEMDEVHSAEPAAPESSDRVAKVNEWLMKMNEGNLTHMSEHLRILTQYNKDGKDHWVKLNELPRLAQEKEKWFNVIYGKVKEAYERFSKLNDPSGLKKNP